MNSALDVAIKLYREGFLETPTKAELNLLGFEEVPGKEYLKERCYEVLADGLLELLKGSEED